MDIKLICPYCTNKAELVKGIVVYPHIPELKEKNFWYCKDCDAFIGCHAPNKGNNFRDDVPFGRMSNKELREIKIKVHTLFSNLWKAVAKRNNRVNKQIKQEAYIWLAGEMNISKYDCRIGQFSLEQCKEAIKIMSKKS